MGPRSRGVCTALRAGRGEYVACLLRSCWSGSESAERDGDRGYSAACGRRMVDAELWRGRPTRETQGAGRVRSYRSSDQYERLTNGALWAALLSAGFQ